MRLKQYEIQAIKPSGESWQVLINRAALGRALYEPAGQQLIEKMRESGIDSHLIEQCIARVNEPYKLMLKRRAASRLAEYRRNPKAEALEDVVDVFTAMVDDEIDEIPLVLLRAIADLLRSIRTAKTPKEAEGIARRLRIRKSVSFNLERARAVEIYKMQRSAGVKDIVAKQVAHEMLKETGSNMTPDDVKNAVRAEAKRKRHNVQ